MRQLTSTQQSRRNAIIARLRHLRALPIARRRRMLIARRAQ